MPDTLTTVTTASTRRRGRWIPGLIAVAALLTIGVVFGAGGDLSHPAPTSLSARDIDSQIATGIQVQQRLSSPPVLHCPDHEPVRKGLRFRCSASGVHGAGVVDVDVVEIDGRGHLRWSLGAGGPG